MSKVISGSRAKVYVNEQLVGIFESCSISSAVSTEPIFILGRHTAAEQVILNQEIVNVSCSGFRIAGQGKHVLPKVPKVQDLLNFEPFTITVVDRQTGQQLAVVKQVVPGSNNENFSAKASTRISVSYTGIMMTDESGDQSESAGAADLP